MNEFDTARALLHEFKGDTYLHGLGVLPQAGQAVAALGKHVALIRCRFPGCEAFVDPIRASVQKAGATLVAEIKGAAPNAPREDLLRITAELSSCNPEVLVSLGGGSIIDCVKAADVLHVLGGEIEQYFGTGLVTQALAVSGKRLTPHVAIQTAASSAAHLTKSLSENRRRAGFLARPDSPEGLSYTLFG